MKPKIITVSDKCDSDMEAENSNEVLLSFLLYNKIHLNMSWHILNKSYIII